MPPNTFAQRLFSLSGLVPLATFAVLHVVEQSSAVFGAPGAWRGQASAGVVVRALLFWAPLAFHTAYGVKLWLTRSPNGSSDAFGAPYRRLERLTGALTLVFVVWHALAFRGAPFYEQLEPVSATNELYASLSSTVLGVPLIAATYLSGVIAVAFHLAYGCYRALSNLGFVRSDAAKKRLAAAVTVAGGAWLLVSFATLLKAATGTLLPF